MKAFPREGGMHSLGRGTRYADHRKLPSGIGVECMHIAKNTTSKRRLIISPAVSVSLPGYTRKYSKDICSKV